MTDLPDSRFTIAVQHFHAARQRADLEMISARLLGKSAELLPFDEVRRRVGATAQGEKQELRLIPLSAIVGSVGRYSDFTRSFLPRNESDRTRWSTVAAAFASERGVPPIHVFQLGDVYFVVDGNHRVSVARSLNLEDIEAYVTPIKTRVPITSEVDLDNLIIIEEYADFLERTALDESRPAVDFRMTVPGRYQTLLDFIELHRYHLAETRHSEVTLPEAAVQWCDEVYLPLVRIIRERGILRDFAGRTECDLCVWLARYREELSKSLGWAVKPEAAADDLVARYSPKGTIRRFGDRVRDAVIPSTLASGPATGKWREERQAPDPDSLRLFRDILVPVSGHEQGWRALEQALVIARREGSEVHGIYVAPDGAISTVGEVLEAQFASRCTREAIPGTLTVQTGGTIADVVRERGEWNDLMVLRLSFPPGTMPIDRIRSGFSNLIRTTSCPILAVPGEATLLQSPLLAYDDSPKAREALFIATYLVGCWNVRLTVVTISDGKRGKALANARRYLEEQGIEADFVELPKRNQSVGQHILHTAWARESDLILMGGYGATPALEIVMGSSVDEVLRHTTVPVLICR